MSTLVELVSKLKLYTESESHKKVYEVAKEVLKKDNQDLNALKQCLVALINMDNYEEALALIEKYKALIAKDSISDKLLLLERAYIYYKTNKGEELEKLIPLGENIRGFQHVLAQYYYRSGESAKALKLYEQLLSSPEGEESDLSVNKRAVQSQLKYQDSSRVINISGDDLEVSYDLMSNDALVKVREEKYDKALSLLKTALSTAQENLKDYEEDSKFSEIAPIEVQIAYIKQLMGDDDGADEILSKFDLANVKDNALKLLISNNLASLRADSNSNPALLYRELGLPSSLHNIIDRLTIPQIRGLQRNEFLLAQGAGKDLSDAAERHFKSQQGSFLGKALVTLGHIGVDLRDLKYEKNDKKVFRYSLKHPEDLPFALLAAQICITFGNLQNAASVLENAVNHDRSALINRESIAVTPLLYYVYEKLERRKSIFALLNEVYEAISSDESLKDTEQLKLAEFVAFQLLSVDSEKSRQLFEQVAKAENENEGVYEQSSLVKAIIRNDTSQLPEVESLTQGVDVDALLDQGLNPLLSSSSKIFLAGRKSAINSNRKAAKHRRHRQKPRRLPKNTIGNIDEERWLPLKDRSYYRSKKGKSSNKTQGGVADESLNVNNQTKEPEQSAKKGNGGKKRKNKKKNKGRR
ncbi:hypothetical protein HII13_001606 [Brettanomyces bruxellensis]|uniref:Signal recognition particle subunit SRP72 n=1 Tax=Dekkera bruxellensis TaxID=5007 RepID=A0A8H6BPP1_DEKBR|nr:hypothetical protein HII13_001606 [Brettanomyces bruxellensis]KAF6015512.1 hypothetical protein HII12_000671 [Brettanomyces bruxellensis]